MCEHKYKYVLNGKTYFVVLFNDEVRKFEDRYGVTLTLWEERKEAFINE